MFAYSGCYYPGTQGHAAYAEFVDRVTTIYRSLAEGLDDRDRIEMDVHISFDREGRINEYFPSGPAVDFNELHGLEAINELNRLGLGIVRHNNTWHLG